MKKISHFLLLLFCCSLMFGQKIERVKQFGDNPGHLRMFQYIPETLDTHAPCPLVMVLHGSWQSAKALSHSGGWNKLADSLGFMIVYPDQPLYNNLLTVFSFYRPKKMMKGQGETASIRQMIDHMQDTWNIDNLQIYIIGMSAGGAMANVMLNAYPDLFEAGALIAAPSVMHGEQLITRSHIPRLAIIHGERDMIVWPENVDRLMEQWTEKHDLDSSTYTQIDNYWGNPYLSVLRYDKAGETVLLRMNIARTNHLLLIDPGDDLQHGGKHSLFSKDIDFHLPYWIMDFFGLVSERMR